MKNLVTTSDKQLFICGSDERDKYRSREVTHLLTIANPGVTTTRPAWFNGHHLELWFGDVVSETDAKRCRTKPPTIDDVQQGVDFFRGAWKSADSRVSISCDYGASRSPALAYVCVADQLGFGQESAALRLIMKIRPVAVPNRLVIEFGDTVLARNGALLKPLNELPQ